MIDVTAVLAYVGGNDTEFAQSCLDEAIALVAAYVGQTVVPDSVLDRAHLEVASELWHRRNSPSGIQQFATFDGVAPRLAKDPMSGAYAMLNRWVVTM